MTTMRQTVALAPQGVLRGIALDPRPRGLARPTQEPEREAALARESADHARGYAEGYQEGREAERKAQAEALQAALQEQAAEAARASREQARERGLEEGRAEAARVLDEALAASARRCAALHAEMTKALRDAMALLEDDVVVMVHEAVCRMLGDHAVQPEVLKAQVRQLLADHGERRIVAVHVHPEDHAWLTVSEEGDDPPWVPDPEVRLGGVRVESPHGALDARLEIQLVALGEVLRSTRAARAGEAAA